MVYWATKKFLTISVMGPDAKKKPSGPVIEPHTRT